MKSAMFLFLLLAILNGIHGKEPCSTGNCTENNNLLHNSWYDLNENEMFGTSCQTSIKGDFQKSKWYWEARFWCPSLSEIKGISKKQKSRDDAINRAIIDYIQKGEKFGFLTGNHLEGFSDVDSNSISSTNDVKKSRHTRGLIDDVENLISNGSSVKVFSNGIYRGDMVNGVMHGAGVYTWNDGAKYIGAWRNGNMHGKLGIYRFTNGSWYIGEFRNDEMTGYGTMLYDNNYKYEGDFVSGLKNGFGKETWKDDTKFIGKFQNDERHGFGYWIRADGTRKAALYVYGTEI